MKTRTFLLGALCAGLFTVSNLTYGADEGALAKESAAKCKATAGQKPTLDLVKQKVDAAADLLKKDGTKAFPKFKGKDSDFLFCGTYIWIHDMKGKMRMHPIKHKMQGKRLLGLRDAKGKLFFMVMNTKLKKDESAWVDYYWPKPGEKKASQKVSYVKKVTTPEGEDLVVGCGVYDMPKGEIDNLVK